MVAPRPPTDEVRAEGPPLGISIHRRVGSSPIILPAMWEGRSVKRFGRR